MSGVFFLLKPPCTNAVPAHDTLKSPLRVTFSFPPRQMRGDEREENRTITSKRCSILKAERTLPSTDAGLEGRARKGRAPSPPAALPGSSVTRLPPPPGCTPRRRPPRGSSCACRRRRGRTPAASSPARSTGRRPGECGGKSLPQILPSYWPAPRRGSPAGGTPRRRRPSSSRRRTPCPTRRRRKPPPGPGPGRGPAAPSAARRRSAAARPWRRVSSSCAALSSLLPSWAWGSCPSALAWRASRFGSSAAGRGRGFRGLAGLPGGPRPWPSAVAAALGFSQ